MMCETTTSLDTALKAFSGSPDKQHVQWDNLTELLQLSCGFHLEQHQLSVLSLVQRIGACFVALHDAQDLDILGQEAGG